MLYFVIIYVIYLYFVMIYDAVWSVYMKDAPTVKYWAVSKREKSSTPPIW